MLDLEAEKPINQKVTKFASAAKIAETSVKKVPLAPLTEAKIPVRYKQTELKCQAQASASVSAEVQLEPKQKIIDEAEQKLKQEMLTNLLNTHSTIKRKITDTIAQDRKCDLKWDVHDYVDKTWIIKSLVKLRMKCSKCSQQMLYKWPIRDKAQWCLDRIDPQNPCVKSNCRIICYRCKIFPETTIDIGDLE